MKQKPVMNNRKDVKKKSPLRFYSAQSSQEKLKVKISDENNFFCQSAFIWFPCPLDAKCTK